VAGEGTPRPEEAQSFEHAAAGCRNPFRWLLIAPIRAYQRVFSPFLGQRCRYYPSCSEYAAQAIERYGILRGLVLAGWRLLRCNPWSAGGVDLVEDQRLFRTRRAPASTPDPC
jgi:putative membrane protein insertion efficiency factor